MAESTGVTEEQVLERLLPFIQQEIEVDKVFKSGKIGHGAYGKLKIGDNRYQVSVNLTKLSK